MEYSEYCDQSYNELYHTLYTQYLNGRTSESAKKNAERSAQHEAIIQTFNNGYNMYSPEVDAADIWNAIYRAHLFRKSDIRNINQLDEVVVDAIISAAQAGKKVVDMFLKIT